MEHILLELLAQFKLITLSATQLIVEEITSSFLTIGELNQIKEMIRKVNSSKLRNKEVQADLINSTNKLKTRFLLPMDTTNLHSLRKEVSQTDKNSREAF
tara:strand:+ start:558 stop:857 length:300 start_codon:yes stop_codon:yes gene_type:complete